MLAASVCIGVVEARHKRSRTRTKMFNIDFAHKYFTLIINLTLINTYPMNKLLKNNSEKLC